MKVGSEELSITHNLCMKQRLFVCLSCWGPPNHGGFCYILGVIGNLDKVWKDSHLRWIGVHQIGFILFQPKSGEVSEYWTKLSLKFHWIKTTNYRGMIVIWKFIDLKCGRYWNLKWVFNGNSIKLKIWCWKEKKLGN